MEQRLYEWEGESETFGGKDIVQLPLQEDYLALFHGIPTIRRQYLKKECTCTRLKIGESCVTKA